jgi:hypothetical protein
MFNRKLWKKLGFINPKSGLIDPYLVLEENSGLSEFKLSDEEWKTIMTIFKSHPELVKVWAPIRDPEQERNPFTYSSSLKRIILGEDKDWTYILKVQKRHGSFQTM